MELKYTTVKQGDRTYMICNSCHSYMSSERCLSCEPLSYEDLGKCLRPELSKYYDRPKVDGVVPKHKIRVAEYTMHHILEYWYTAEQLMSKGLYYDVPIHHLMKVRTRDHNRVLASHKLHLSSPVKIPIEDLTPEYAEELLKQFPSKLRELFEVK